ncbi:MAG: hypothetical protein ACJ8GN_19465 [Longimicrobiaceae bacterium]
MEPVSHARVVLGLGLGAVLLQKSDTSASSQVPLDPEVALPRGGGGGEMDPLNTVGLALLAYGLVQLLAKVVDKLPVGRGEPQPAPAAAAANGGGFTADDRKRLERVYEQALADRERLERLEDAFRDQLAVHQRLIGQALDDLREVHGKLDNVLRKLRAMWTRVGRRGKDRG